MKSRYYLLSFQTRLILFGAIAMILLSACGPRNLPSSDTQPIGAGEVSSNNISIRLDQVYFHHQEGVSRDIKKAFFTILVARSAGQSAKLLIPGDGYIEMRPNSAIKLNDFSITINNVKPDETIHVYFVAFNEDKDDPQLLLASVALDATTFILGEAPHPLTKISAYALEKLGGSALDWWAEADILGEHSLNLSPYDDWSRGIHDHFRPSGSSISFSYTIMHSTEVGQSSSKEANILTLRNDTPHSIAAVYIRHVNSEDWGPNLLAATLKQGETQQFRVFSGSYHLRAESANKSYWWENSFVDLTKDRLWTIELKG